MTTTAGTAGFGYRLVPVACAWEAEPVEYGERPRCSHCGREKATHLPTPRGTSEEKWTHSDDYCWPASLCDACKRRLRRRPA